MPTALIADDERLMREQLRSRLREVWPELEVVAEARNGQEAVTLTEQRHPDVVFLDIRMPVLTGVDAARQIAQLPTYEDASDWPGCEIVFVTAYDQYAVQAFEQGVVDYVLKPYTDERLQAAVERLQARLGQVPAAVPQDLEALLARLSSKLALPTEQLKWIKASVGQNLRLISIDDVLFFQSDEKYTLVATAEFDALIRTPIKEILEGVDAAKFWQIHRSTIVNASAIEAVSRDFRGQATVKVKGRKENLAVSRPFSHLFKQM